MFSVPIGKPPPLSPVTGSLHDEPICNASLPNYLTTWLQQRCRNDPSEAVSSPADVRILPGRHLADFSENTPLRQSLTPGRGVRRGHIGLHYTHPITGPSWCKRDPGRSASFRADVKDVVAMFAHRRNGYCDSVVTRFVEEHPILQHSHGCMNARSSGYRHNRSNRAGLVAVYMMACRMFRCPG
jgi:hypothetical protein